jgi:hypothetical protein
MSELSAFEKTKAWFNQLLPTLLLLALAFIVVLMVVLAKTENQRYALLTFQCEDPLFKGHDVKCLEQVRTRPHWWQHVIAAFKN